jgi:hypothetical protein
LLLQQQLLAGNGHPYVNLLAEQAAPVGEASKLEKGKGRAGDVIYWCSIMFSTPSPKYAGERGSESGTGELASTPASSEANSRLVAPLIK